MRTVDATVERAIFKAVYAAIARSVVAADIVAVIAAECGPIDATVVDAFVESESATNVAAVAVSVERT